MSLIGTRSFKGEIPRAEPHLLSDNNAQLALDCDFANGSVKPIKGGFFMQTMQNNPVRGIYPDNGLNFYTWQQETLAFSSPVIDDAYNRLYYLTPAEGVFRVVSKVGMTPFGPSPAPGSYWKAGVPRPTVAPKLSLIDRTSLIDYPNISIVAEAWWEDGSAKQYNRGAVTMAEVTPFKKYTFTKPTHPTQPTGDNAVAVAYMLSVRITFKNADNNTDIMSALIRPGSTARSNSLHALDVADYLETVESCTASPAGLGVNAGLADTSRVRVWHEGGTHGADYKVTVVVTTHNGERFEDEIICKVREV